MWITVVYKFLLHLLAIVFWPTLSVIVACRVCKVSNRLSLAALGLGAALLCVVGGLLWAANFSCEELTNAYMIFLWITPFVVLTLVKHIKYKELRWASYALVISLAIPSAWRMVSFVLESSGVVR